MGYNIKCVFVYKKNGNDEIVSCGIINDLKILNSQKYEISFSDIKETTDNVKFNNMDKSLIYDQNSFIQGALYYYGKMEEERKFITKLDTIINSIEYYKLTLEQKTNITEDLVCANDSLEIFELAYLSCRKMIDLFEYFEHNEIINELDNRNNKIYCCISAV